MQHTLLNHIIRSLTALTMLTSALVAAPTDKQTQIKEAIRLSSPSSRAAWCALAGTSVLAGSYLLYRGVQGWSQAAHDQTAHAADVQLTYNVTDDERESIAMLETTDLIWLDDYPAHIGNLYTAMLKALSTDEEQRIPSAQALQGKLLRLIELYKRALSEQIDEKEDAREVIISLLTWFNSNSNGFLLLNKPKVVLLPGPAHQVQTGPQSRIFVTVPSHQRDAIATLLEQPAQAVQELANVL